MMRIVERHGVALPGKFLNAPVFCEFKPFLLLQSSKNVYEQVMLEATFDTSQFSLLRYILNLDYKDTTVSRIPCTTVSLLSI